MKVLDLAPSVIKQKPALRNNMVGTIKAPKSPRKSPSCTPKKSPSTAAARSPRSARICKGGTPTSALRHRKAASLSLTAAFEEAELVAVEQESAFEAGEFTGVRPDGREAPKLVDFRSPPRAVFRDAIEARDARLKSRTSCLKLSDKDAFVHVERLSQPPPRFQGYEATDNVVACQPIPMRSPSPSPCEQGMRPGLAAVRAEHLRPLSRQSSLNSIAWGSIGAGRSAVETPPSAPSAFEASELHGLCRAPLAQNRATAVSRSCMRTESRALSSVTAASVAVSSATAVTVTAPFPRRVPVWGEKVAHVPVWGQAPQGMGGFVPISGNTHSFSVAASVTHSDDASPEVAQVMRSFVPINGNTHSFSVASVSPSDDASPVASTIV